MSTPSQLHAHILKYIAQLQSAGNSADNGVTDAEPLEIAAQCIVEATGADAKSAKVRAETNNREGGGREREERGRKICAHVPRVHDRRQQVQLKAALFADH